MHCRLKRPSQFLYGYFQVVRCVYRRTATKAKIIHDNVNSLETKLVPPTQRYVGRSIHTYDIQINLLTMFSDYYKLLIIASEAKTAPGKTPITFFR